MSKVGVDTAVEAEAETGRNGGGGGHDLPSPTATNNCQSILITSIMIYHD